MGSQVNVMDSSKAKDQDRMVLLADRMPYQSALQLLQGLAVIETASSPSEHDILEKVEKCDAIIVWRGRISRKVIETGGNLKIIAERGVGVDNIDLKAATEKGVYVTNVPGVNTVAVAEHTLGLILALSKNIRWADAFVKAGNWIKEDIPEVTFELRGKTLGLIGLGKIGSEVSRFATSLGMKVQSYDPYVNKDYASKVGVELVDLETLLRSADVVSVHATLSNETRGLIGEEELKLMKKSSILINTSRSQIIVNEALYRALNEGWIRAAGLDVFPKEPIDPKDPLLSLSNILLTPHIAGMPARPKAAFGAANEVARILRGDPPLHPVNRIPVRE